MWSTSSTPSTRTTTSWPISRKRPQTMLGGGWGFLPHPIEDRVEERSRRVPAVVPERELVEIVLQVGRADRVVDASDPVLEESKKALDGLRSCARRGVE